MFKLDFRLLTRKVADSQPSPDPPELLTAKTNTLGDFIEVRFTKLMDNNSIGFNLADMTIKVNGTAVEIDPEYYEGIWDALGYRFYRTDYLPFVTFGDEVTITITSGNWKGSNNALLTGVQNYPVINDAQIALVKTATSGTNIFNYAHGTCQVGENIFLGTRTSPTKLIKFSGLEHQLIDTYTAITLTGFNTIESMVYDEENNRIYATCNVTGDNNLRIMSINPANISDHAIVFNSSELDGQISFAIVTDGTYVYGANQLGFLFKIRISDWTLIATKETNILNFHAAQICKYSDRTEMYLTTANLQYPMPYFVKVNCENLAFQYIELHELCIATDDFAFLKVDDNGGFAFVGSEQKNNGVAYLAKINTQTMTYTAHAARETWGTFIYGSDLYLLSGTENLIVKYPDFDFDHPIVRLAGPEDMPNEFFFSAQHCLYYTSFTSPGLLVRFQFPPVITSDSNFEVIEGTLPVIGVISGGFGCQYTKEANSDASMFILDPDSGAIEISGTDPLVYADPWDEDMNNVYEFDVYIQRGWWASGELIATRHITITVLSA